MFAPATTTPELEKHHKAEEVRPSASEATA